jgi:hypothetical protein
MAYFLNTKDTQKLFDLPVAPNWPIQIDIPSKQATFYFKDKADYLQQRENNSIVKENIKLSGIDY